MKEYGYNKATEFTKKQINVIFAKAKSGELKVEKWIISEFYDLAEFYGIDDNRNVENAEMKILKILDEMFSNNISKCQELIDEYTADSFNRMSPKNQAKVDRAFVA